MLTNDLESVAQRRACFKDVARLDVGLARRLAGQLPAQWLREAFEAVLIGDIGRAAPDPALAAARR